jgi:phenylalanyl-tRNA synthetase beta chain
VLNGYGYSEVINYSFISPVSADVLGLSDKDKGRRFIRLQDPLSEDMSVMRTNLVYGLLATMRKNSSAGNRDLRIFEMGKVFTDIGEELPREDEKIGALICGARYDRLWHFDEDVQVDFYDLKGCAENLFDAVRINGVRFASGCDHPFLHPGRSCRIIADGTTIGFLGDVHPRVLEKMDIKEKAVICEIDLHSLIPLVREDLLYHDIPKFPSVSRDVAFVVDEAVEGRRLLDLALEKNENLLEYIDIFDVYIGQGIPQGEKSLAVRFTYRSATKTLTDDEVNKVHERLVKTIVKNTGAKIRGLEM